MQQLSTAIIVKERITIPSSYLERDVIIDFFLPKNLPDPASMSLLLINDGQNLEEMSFEKTLNLFYAEGAIRPLLCAGIHASEERKQEYGVASQADYQGRGSKAGLYTSFILQELLPYIHQHFAIPSFVEKAFAGFSLGGLSALDIAWNNPGQFSKCGVFSGSFWWRSLDQDNKNYDDDRHRIMHQVIRHGKFSPGLNFFFQCGNMDETMDRNKNGIIDSIDDTLDLVNELVKKGYDRRKDIFYVEMPDGKHDIPTWARAMDVFLKWGWTK